MLNESLIGLLASSTVTVLWLLNGRPGREQLEVFALGFVLAFIDGFMAAYLAPFFPVFASKVTFHIFYYLLLASLTAVLYASYRRVEDLRVYAVAMAPWLFILVLVVAAALTNSRVVFIV